jgi:hypothetical protein
VRSVEPEGALAMCAVHLPVGQNGPFARTCTPLTTAIIMAVAKRLKVARLAIWQTVRDTAVDIKTTPLWTPLADLTVSEASPPPTWLQNRETSVNVRLR